MTKSVVAYISALFVLCLSFVFGSNLGLPMLFADSYQIETTPFPELQDNDPATTHFYDVTVANNILYVSNSKQEAKINTYNLNENMPQLSYLTLPDNYYPTLIDFNYFDETLYFADENNPGIRTTTSEYVKYYDRSDLETPISMLRIYSFTISMNGTIFILTQSFNDNDFIIIYKESHDTFFSLLVNLSDLSTPITLANNSRIVTDTYGQNIWFNDETTLYEYNISTGFKDLSYNLPATYDKIVDMKMDMFSHLYILTDSTTNQKSFIKSTKTDNIIVTDSENKITANGFSINYEDGTIFTFSDTQLYRITIQNEQISFFPSFADIENDNTWQTATPTEVCTIQTTTAATMLYPFENLYKQGIAVSANTKVILLKEIENSIFNHVLINNGDSKNQVGFIKKSHLNNCSTQNSDISQVVPIFSKTTIYTYPTTLETGENEIILTTLASPSQNTAPILEVLNSPEFPTDFNNVNFYAIRYGTLVGYIDKNMVVDATSTAIKRMFISNAKINETTDVYSDFNLTTKADTLSANTEIQVEITENNTAKIFWLNGDKVFVGYINTKYVNDGNLTTTQIIGIIIMAVAVLTTVLVLIIRHNRHKKLKRKINETKQALEN